MSPPFIAHEVVSRVVARESIERGDTAAQHARIRGRHRLDGPPGPAVRLGLIHLGRHAFRVGDQRLPKVRCVLGLGHDLLTRYLDRDTQVLRDSVYAALVQGAPHRRDQRFQFAHFHLGERTVTPIAQRRKLAQARITLRIEGGIVIGGNSPHACCRHIMHVEQVVYAQLQGQRDRFEYLDVGALHAAISRERGESLIINGQTVPHGNVVTQILQAQPSLLEHATHP